MDKSTIHAVIEATDLSVAFRTSTGILQVLHDIHFEVRQGEWLTIVGRNGSGKSTLARVIANLCDISKGSLRIMGSQRLKGAQASSNLYQDVQMVFQNPEAQIIGETVYEDVSFGPSMLAAQMNLSPDESMNFIETTVVNALRQVNLTQLRDAPVSTLSGGQKQLLCIADCLAMNPQILIFDECTSMLDEGARQLVRKVVQQLQQAGKTVIWITQHMEELADAHRVIALDQGRIIFNDTPQTFFARQSDRQLSPCRQFGFTPSYIVQIGEQLANRGIFINPMPLTPEELVKAVEHLCPSN